MVQPGAKFDPRLPAPLEFEEKEGVSRVTQVARVHFKVENLHMHK